MDVTLFQPGGQIINCRAMPDSGTTRTIIAKRVFKDAYLELDKSRKVPIRCASVSTSLNCAGAASLQLTFEGQTIEIDALVVTNLAEDALIAYGDLVRLGVLHNNFPTRLATREATFNVAEKKEVQEHDTQAEVERLTREYADVFDDASVTPISGPPMVITLHRSSPTY